MINVPSLIDIIHDGLNQLTDADKKSIKYQIESSRISPSLYIYKTTASGSLNILRVSDHLPHMQGLVRDGNIPRPSADDGANVSIDFYIPKKAEPIGKASEKKRKKFIKNEFKNFVGVPITIPTVKPFTVTSYEYSYKNLEQQDEMIIWHCIATWISCLKPDRVFHDPFAQDKVKKAKVETKIANVKVFGDTVEITESKSNKNMKKTITESQLRQIVKESVKKVLREADEENGEALNFYDFVDILKKNGWSYSGYQEVSNKQGQTGIRYRLYPERNASSADELIKQLQQAAVSPDGVIPSRWSNRYAPEQNGLSVVILN